MTLATAKATEFCSARGETLVTQNLESRNLNAVGAGGSEIQFTCVAGASESDIQSCYNDFFDAIQAEFGDAGTELLLELADYSTFDRLANETIPSTPVELDTIRATGRGIEKCETLAISAMPPERADIATIKLGQQLATIAELAGRGMSYGNFARKMAEIDAQEIAALRELNYAAKEERRWLEEQRLQSMQNLNTQINRLSNPR